VSPDAERVPQRDERSLSLLARLTRQIAPSEIAFLNLEPPGDCGGIILNQENDQAGSGCKVPIVGWAISRERRRIPALSQNTDVVDHS
jgi:hypothetical protein